VKPNKSTEAARKKIDAGNKRLIATQCRESNDRTGSGFYDLEAERLEAEADALLRPDHPVVIGTGGEAVQGEPENFITDLLLKDPTSVSLDSSTKRLELLERVDAVAPALDAADSIKARNSLERMLAHQMSVAHVTAMELLAEAKHIRGASTSENAQILSLKKQNMARMFLDVYVRQMEALVRIRSGGRQNITVTYKNVNVTGGQALIADKVTSGARQGGAE
jgi:hypothetical protein